MAGRIPRDFIDDLIARADIVEVVNSRVQLKKAGRNYQACCPFHNEKTPSFSVSQEKQFYHCFGCGAHGNVISFLMEHDRLEFPEAVEDLARFMGVEVPREKGTFDPQHQQKKQQRQDDYALMDKVAKHFQSHLTTHQDRKRPQTYLAKRGLSADVINEFDIGYASQAWDSVLKQFGHDTHTQQQLVDLKVVNQNDKGKRYDFFRDRIMFPIKDRRGRVVGFGGRILDQEGPKYLNSPETRIFHKGSELYGFYQARQKHRNLERLLIVEGYMDVVALAQFGIDYAVAALGTATTPDHIQLMLRNTSKITCCYDGDNAGRQAAWRTLENALPMLKDGVELSFLFLPDGEDPDTLVRKIGKEAFESELKNAKPMSKFFFENLLKEHNVASTEGKAALKSVAAPMINRIIGEHQKALLLAELAKLTGEFDQHRNQTQLQAANQVTAPRKADYRAPQKTKTSPIRMMLKLLIEQPSLAKQHPNAVPSALTDITLPGFELLCEVHQHCLSHPQHTSPQLLEQFRQHAAYPHLMKLLVWEHHIAEEQTEQVYVDSFKKLLEWCLTGRMESLLAKSRVQALDTAEKQELNNLLLRLK